MLAAYKQQRVGLTATQDDGTEDCRPVLRLLEPVWGYAVQHQHGKVAPVCYSPWGEVESLLHRRAILFNLMIYVNKLRLGSLLFSPNLGVAPLVSHDWS